MIWPRKFSSYCMRPSVLVTIQAVKLMLLNGIPIQLQRICLQPSAIHSQYLFISCQKLLENVVSMQVSRITLKVDSFLTWRRALEKRCIGDGPFSVPNCTEYAQQSLEIKHTNKSKTTTSQNFTTHTIGMAQKCNPEPAAWGASPDERILVDMLHSTNLPPYQVSVLIGVWTLLKLSGFSSGLVNL